MVKKPKLSKQDRASLRIHISQKLYQRIKDVARKRDVSIATVVKDALNDYLRKWEAEEVVAR